MHTRIDSLLEKCFRDGKIDAVHWIDEMPSPSFFGLQRRQNVLIATEGVELLRMDYVRDKLPLKRLIYTYAIDSTNTTLKDLSLLHSIDQCLVTSECQLDGRGRRGKSWISPFARNLAFTYGHAISKSKLKLGGVSLVVGLAVLEALTGLGAVNLKVKWPNDIVLGEQKICGILVELLSKDDYVEVVIGIGINAELDHADRESVERPVTDLRSVGVFESRNDVLIEVVRVLQQFLKKFNEIGFEPFVQAFNRSHIYHRKACNVHQGDTIITGRVEGVDVDGALILSTENGIRSFHGGEVSLRAT